MIRFHDLPFDILQRILDELSVQDLIHVGMISKSLYEASQDHHVWLPRAKDIWAALPTMRQCHPPLLTLTTQELKREVVRQTQLELRWRARIPGYSILKAQPLEGLPPILLPGGDYFVVVTEDGLVSLKGIDGLYVIRDVSEVQLQGDGSVLALQSELTSTGVLVAVTFEDGDYILRVTTNPPIITLVRKLIDQGVGMSLSHIRNDRVIYFDALWTISVVPLQETLNGARHTGATNVRVNLEPIWDRNTKMCLLAENTLLLCSLQRICVYHLPQTAAATRGHQIPKIKPIWTWSTDDFNRTLAIGKVFWDETLYFAPTFRLVWDTKMHIIKFTNPTNSPSRLEVNEHIVHPLLPVMLTPLPSFVLKSWRGVWWYQRHTGHKFSFATDTLSEHEYRGQVTFRLQFPDLESRSGTYVLYHMDFDEISGRFLFYAVTTRRWPHSGHIFFMDTLAKRG